MHGENFKSSGDEDAVELPSYKYEKQKAAENAGRIIWRGANAMMTAFFIMASGVQFNDPDPFLWVPLYGTAAVLTASITIRPCLIESRIWKWVYWIHTMFCTGMFFYVLVDLVLVATNPQSDGSLNPLTYEEGRELSGIVITVLWLFACKQTPNIRYTLPSWFPSCKSRPSGSHREANVNDEVGYATLLDSVSRI